MTETGVDRLLSPIIDRDAERAVIGVALMAATAAERLTAEEGLRPSHFYTATHAAAWQAIVQAAAEGEEPEAARVAARLRRDATVPEPGGGWARLLNECVAGVAAAGNVRAYARSVIDAWRREKRRRALLDGVVAVQSGDEAAFGRALADAESTAARVSGPDLTKPEVFADAIGSWLIEPKRPGLPMPWPRLGKLLALRPGATTVLGGWTSIGKSMVSLHLAAHVADRDLRAVVWTNEMSKEEIGARQITRTTGVAYEHIMNGTVPERSADTVMAAAAAIPLGVQPCHGWPAEEIAAHIRAVKPDLAVLDHFHALPGVGKTDKADDAISALIAAAGQAHIHLLVVAQLNQARNQGVVRQPPVLRDLRGTGNLFNLPNNVLFVHRREVELTDDDGNKLDQAETTDEGHFEIAKQRGGPSSLTVPVTFNASRMRFLESAA